MEDVAKDETSIVSVDVEKGTDNDVDGGELGIQTDVDDIAAGSGVDKAGGSTPFFPLGPLRGVPGAASTPIRANTRSGRLSIHANHTG